MSPHPIPYLTRAAALAAALMALAAARPAPRKDASGAPRSPARTASPASRRDAVGGPRELQGVLPSGSADSWTIHFLGERPARIDAAGDGAGDVDCLVYDAAGALVQFDIDAADRCTLRWTPARTAAFRVVVRNVGARADRYTLRTN